MSNPPNNRQDPHTPSANNVPYGSQWPFGPAMPSSANNGPYGANASSTFGGPQSSLPMQTVNQDWSSAPLNWSPAVAQSHQLQSALAHAQRNQFLQALYQQQSSALPSSSSSTMSAAARKRNGPKLIGSKLAIVRSFFTPHNHGALHELPVSPSFDFANRFVVPEDKPSATVHLRTMFKWDLEDLSRGGMNINDTSNQTNIQDILLGAGECRSNFMKTLRENVKDLVEKSDIEELTDTDIELIKKGKSNSDARLKNPKIQRLLSSFVDSDDIIRLPFNPPLISTHPTSNPTSRLHEGFLRRPIVINALKILLWGPNALSRPDPWKIKKVLGDKHQLTTITPYMLAAAATAIRMLFSHEKEMIGDGVSSKISASWARDYYSIVSILINDASQPAIQDLFQHAQIQIFGTSYRSPVNTTTPLTASGTHSSGSGPTVIYTPTNSTPPITHTYTPNNPAPILGSATPNPFGASRLASDHWPQSVSRPDSSAGYHQDQTIASPPSPTFLYTLSNPGTSAPNTSSTLNTFDTSDTSDTANAAEYTGHANITTAGDVTDTADTADTPSAPSAANALDPPDTRLDSFESSQIKATTYEMNEEPVESVYNDDGIMQDDGSEEEEEEEEEGYDEAMSSTSAINSTEKARAYEERLNDEEGVVDDEKDADDAEADKENLSPPRIPMTARHPPKITLHPRHRLSQAATNHSTLASSDHPITSTQQVHRTSPADASMAMADTSVPFVLPTTMTAEQLSAIQAILSGQVPTTALVPPASNPASTGLPLPATMTLPITEPRQVSVQPAVPPPTHPMAAQRRHLTPARQEHVEVDPAAPPKKSRKRKSDESNDTTGLPPASSQATVAPSTSSREHLRRGTVTGQGRKAYMDTVYGNQDDGEAVDTPTAKRQQHGASKNKKKKVVKKATANP